MTRRAITAVFIFVLLFLPGTAGAASPGRVFRVGTWKTAQTIQPFFYENFVPKGKKVEVFSFTNPADQKAALLAGSLDFCGTTIAHAITSASMGQPVVVVAAMCNKSSALVVGRDSRIASVPGLRGKIIGFVPGTMHEILLRETLSKHGMSPEKDVKLLRVDFFDMGAALAGGSIDAFLSGEPFPALSVEKGCGRILSHPYFDDSIGTINAGMLVTEKSVKGNPELVKSLVLAHARATAHLARHKEEWLKKAASFGISLETWQKAEPNIELAWDMDNVFVKRAMELGKRMEALGMIERQPDYERLFNLSFVRSARAALGAESKSGAFKGRSGR